MAATALHTSLVVSILLAVIGLHVTEGTDCPDYWLAFEGSCYLFPHGNRMSFYKAEHFCHQHGGYLVQVEDAAENNFLKQTIAAFKNESFWMGLADDIVDGVWMWTESNTTAEFFDWFPGEPNGKARENCAHFFLNEHFQWNDSQCDLTGSQPLCEIRRSAYPDIVG